MLVMGHDGSATAGVVTLAALFSLEPIEASNESDNDWGSTVAITRFASDQSSG